MQNWKVGVLFFFLLLVGGIIIWKLYLLQIKNGEYYEALALGQQISFEQVQGERGEIFLKDKNLPLAQTKKKNIIYIFPQKLEDKEKSAKILAEILGEKEEDLILLFQKETIFKKEVSDETLKKLKNENLKGVYPDEILGRYYPQKNFASDVIGFLNEEGEGQYGVEGYYDKVLKGEEIMIPKGKSPLGYLTLFLDSKTEEVFTKGADIFLTLDYHIQYFAEKLLKEAKEKFDIDSGQIIVSDPKTGKILALADFPSFDPNQYSSQEDFRIFLNDAIQKPFEPGSVFKPITMAAALEEGLITPDTKYEDKGYVELGGPPIYNFQRRVWGTQTMTDVLEESINTGAVFVQQKLGKDLFLKYLEKFGFFEKTGVDLQGEVFSSNETLKSGVTRDFAVASFGQGIQVTPLQLVRAFSAIANGGKLMRPFVVEEIVKADGSRLKTEPEIQRKVISETTCSKLTSMLVSVVENGSGRRAKIKGYFIAGKTGTAQVPLQTGGYSKDQTIHSFIGFFPAFNPKVLIFIKLDNPKGVGMSEHSTAPLFRKLAKYIIDLWQIPPSYE
jgi:cell division protein FtsI/penicillin-binding protein 2